MIAWTFRPKGVRHSMVDGIYHEFFSQVREKHSRMHEVDKKYIKRDVDNSLPLYCFLQIGNAGWSSLGIRTMYTQVNYLLGYMAFPLESLELVEMWLDPKDLYLTRNTSDMNTVTDSVSHMELCRKDTRNTVEGLIECIKDYQIIAVRSFEFIDIDDYTDVLKVHTDYVSKGLVPTFTCDLFIDDSGNPCELVDGHIVEKDHRYVTDKTKLNGMSAYYRYMSVRDVLSVCNADVQNKVRNRLNDLGITVKDALDRNVSELMDTSDFIVKL